MDVLTEMYVSKEVWDKIKELGNNGDLCMESICLLSVKLSADGSGRYILKLID